MTERTMLSVAEASQRWGISTFSVKRRIDEGGLQAVRIGSRVLIPLAEILRVERDGAGKSRGSRQKGSAESKR
jgi:excisionase family DNA binding protein